MARKEKALVVAQTREEAQNVNEAIRDGLRKTGKLSEGQTLVTYRPVDLGEAQKRDPRWIQPGQFACFHGRYGRFAKGDVCEIAGVTENGVVLIKNGLQTTMSHRYADRFTVATAAETKIAAGDRLQLKFNGTSTEGRPLNNGELVTVRQVRKNGAVVVETDAKVRKTLAPSQRLFVRGFAVTSYGSQGKTVDAVVFADAANQAATDAKQWYVTISRGRKRVVVFTSDKEALRTNIQRIGERELALDLKLSAEAPAPIHQSELIRRSREAIERTRLHNDTMQRIHGASNRHGIAV